MDESKERYSFFGDHSVATAPFGAANLAAFGPESQVERSGSAADIPRCSEVLPRFEGLLEVYRSAEGS